MDKYSKCQLNDGLTVLDVFFNSQDSTRYILKAVTKTTFSVDYVKADDNALSAYCARLGVSPSMLNSGQLEYVDVLRFGRPENMGSKSFSCASDAIRYFKFCCLKQGDLF